MDFDRELDIRVKQANEAVESCLPKDEGAPGRLICAMRYSVLAGGKRIRPVLMGELYRIFGGRDDVIRYFQASMEMIHNSSLCHDDLPALDNDILRRGRPTTHAEFGEAMGILSGDALINYAYEMLLEGISKAENPKYALRAAKIIGNKSGCYGMLGGQSVDVENEKTGVEGDALEIIKYIHEKKTACLIEGSMMAGAALAGANDEMLARIEEIGSRIGLAFQVQDDILDVTSTTEELGKPVFSDEKNQKETYVSIMGLEESAATVKRVTDEAIEMLKELPGDKEFLVKMLSYLAMRKK